MSDLLKLNQQLTFGKTGTIRAFNPFGFDLNEIGQSWTSEEMAGLSFTPGDMLSANQRLLITATPFLCPGKLTEQPLYVYLNGLMVGFAKFAGSRTIALPVPRAAISARASRLLLVIPNAASPKSLGLSGDERALGLAVSSLALISADATPAQMRA